MLQLLLIVLIYLYTFTWAIQSSNSYNPPSQLDHLFIYVWNKLESLVIIIQFYWTPLKMGPKGLLRRHWWNNVEWSKVFFIDISACFININSLVLCRTLDIGIRIVFLIFFFKHIAHQFNNYHVIGNDCSSVLLKHSLERRKSSDIPSKSLKSSQGILGKTLKELCNTFFNLWEFYFSFWRISITPGTRNRKTNNMYLSICLSVCLSVCLSACMFSPDFRKNFNLFFFLIPLFSNFWKLLKNG